MSVAAVDNDARFAQPMLDPDGLRFGRLKLMGESGLHYISNVKSESSALDKGTAAHSILLGGQRVIYYDGKVKPTKDNPNPTKIGPRNGAQWEEFKAKNSDARILSLDEYETANRIADAVRANPKAMAALTGACEQTIRFDFMGFSCRSTPDVRANNNAFFTELKTCRSSKPWRFRSQARWMAYHAQMAFHREAMRRTVIRPDANPEGFIVAVCSSPPFPVTVFRMTPKDFELGDRLIRLWIEDLKNCISSRNFPPYAQDVLDLDIPDDSAEMVFPDGETGSVDVPF